MLEESKLQGFHKWLDTRWKLIVCDVEFPGFLQNFNQKKESPWNDMATGQYVV